MDPQHNEFLEPPQRYEEMENLPIKGTIISNVDENRNCTDKFCIIVGFTFSFLMLLSAIILFN